MPAILIIVAGVIIAVLVVGADVPAFGGQVPTDKVKTIAQAVATHGEGFGIPGAIPTRAHNPGDIVMGDIGNGTINGKTIFASDVDGWNALYKQIQLWVDGQSDYIGPTNTWREIGYIYVCGPNGGQCQGGQNWGLNVSAALGVSPDSTLQEYMNA